MRSSYGHVDKSIDMIGQKLVKQQNMERDGNSEKIQIKVHKNNKSTWKHECEVLDQAWISEQRSLKGDSRLKLRALQRKQITFGCADNLWVPDNLSGTDNLWVR